MKITTNKTSMPKPKQKKKSIDFNMLIAQFGEQYDVVHHVRIEDEDFIFRILGRHEYKKILNNPNLSEFDKEDEICNTCLLYPEGYDLDNASAGIPGELCKFILENSFLDGLESTIRLLEHYKDEMEELEHQMVCIISEAFPNYTLEEIESWNNLRFCKMFARAEWKFNNLRNTSLEDVAELLKSISAMRDEGLTDEEINETMTQPQQQDNAIKFDNKPKQRQPESNTSKKGKQKMTPDKLEEMRKMQEMFPEIKWGQDEILNHGIDDALSNTDSMSTVSPALRPGWK